MSGLTRGEFLKIVQAGPAHQGRKELATGLAGGELSMKAAIKAYCYECSGFYDSGKDDTHCWDGCPLNPYMPYSSNKRKIREGGKGNSDGLKKAREVKLANK